MSGVRGCHGEAARQGRNRSGSGNGHGACSRPHYAIHAAATLEEKSPGPGIGQTEFEADAELPPLGAGTFVDHALNQAVGG